MPDGTVKQINPFTGNEVWAVPGRSSRPLSNSGKKSEKREITEPEDAICSFCSSRYFETPPEKFRWIRNDSDWDRIAALSPENYFETIAEFRCVPNLFEIVTLDYWKKNYGYEPPVSEIERLQAYASSEAGIQHLREVIAYKRSLAKNEKPAPISDEEVIDRSEFFFGGCHELINARQHFTKQNEETGIELVSSGLLTPEEHYYYTRITIEAMQGIVSRNRYVRYVSIFQNWLRPAGASFDHLHKQLVGLDEWGASITHQVRMLQNNPNAFNEYASNFAAMFNLMIAENRLCSCLCRHWTPCIQQLRSSQNQYMPAQVSIVMKSFVVLAILCMPFMLQWDQISVVMKNGTTAPSTQL